MMLWILAVVAVAAFVYYRVIKPKRYWSDQGIVQVRMKDYLYDNFALFLKRISFWDLVLKGYNRFPGHRYIGSWSFNTPTLLLRDPELIKQLTVKDFDHFLDHRGVIQEDVEPLWAKNLFALKGQRWKDMRATLSPTFTSSKMRAMFSLISDCAQQFVEYFAKQNSSKTTEIEMKDIFTRFTNDVIATTAFGIKCDSLDEKDNEFYQMGKELTNFTGFRKTTRFLALMSLPQWLIKYLDIRMFTKEVAVFFMRLISETIEMREKNGIIRPDMIHLLLEARKGHDKHEETNGIIDTGFATVEESHVGKAKKHNITITDEDIMAQALIFFFAGFESVSTLMCFMAYELALHPEIQERLQKEIDETLGKCEGKLTYEALLKMKYFDMVVSETLRKWPNAVAVDRVCNKPYTIPPVRPYEVPVHLKVGDLLWLPIVGIHHDPEYYPNPEKFDPERFSDENKSKINQYAYLPFGSGPRNCIGSRFALLETKTVFFQLLSKFEITVINKTPIPLILHKASFNLTAENGFWLGLKPRDL